MLQQHQRLWKYTLAHFQFLYYRSYFISRGVNLCCYCMHCFHSSSAAVDQTTSDSCWARAAGRVSAQRPAKWNLHQTESHTAHTSAWLLHVCESVWERVCVWECLRVSEYVVSERVYVCVCVCVWECLRVSECVVSERVYVCECVCVTEWVYVCVCEWECMCVCESESMCVFLKVLIHPKIKILSFYL